MAANCGGQICNDNGDCFDGDGPDCPDCQGQEQCDFNGHCDDIESELSCSDCVPCNEDTVCAVTEHPFNCGDCNGIPCNHDLVCTAVVGGGGDEVGRCDDCVTRCDEGCSPDQGCTDFNRRMCQEFASDNCLLSEPGTSICRDRCDDNVVCAEGNTCVRDDFGALLCEPKRCAEGAPCPDGNDVCSGPVDMNRGAGFCLQRCDPVACAFFDDKPSACSCTSDNNPPFTRCAPVHDGSPEVVDFACTVPGPSSLDQGCAIQGDCGEDLACFDGTCRPLCNQAGDNCPAGTCEALTADVNVCVEI